MADGAQAGISRRAFLKGLGALALGALPACKRAQEYAVQPEEQPDWALPGEAMSFASAMPWATGALPLLAVCCDGVPISLQPNPLYTARAGLPAFAQAALLDLYSPRRAASPTFAGRPFPWEGMRSSFRAWARALQQGRRAAFLFPAGFSPVREAQIEALRTLPHVSFHSYDPVAEEWAQCFEPLASMQRTALGEPVRFPSSCGTLDELSAQLPELDLLFIFTPADPAAHDAAFAQALKQSSVESVRFSLFAQDATSRLCLYTTPTTHFLEEWGAEADAYGNLCLRQPVTMPLVPALAEAEALHALLHDGELPDPQRKDISPAFPWLEQAVPGTREKLKKGFCEHAAPLPRPLPAARCAKPYLHPLFVDGRYLHNAWLQEAYDPISGTAGAPAAYLPGQSEERAFAVQIGAHTLPAQRIRELSSPCLPMLPGINGCEDAHKLEKSPFPSRRSHPMPHDAGKPPIIPRGTSPQWGLVIDYSLCVGCNACTIACRSENNIPPVGADEQLRGRDLQWLRLEQYVEGTRRFFVPMMCRQCRQAPCEAVCPVNATVHTSEGLNAMVYPRCWGTRYCAAACPYHARSFNFHDYAREAQKTHALPPNPHVTVRSRGVMEKCTCCVQRLRSSQRADDGKPPRTACQQACPRGAIRLIDWATEDAPARLTARFDVPGTHPSTIYVNPA